MAGLVAVAVLVTMASLIGLMCARVSSVQKATFHVLVVGMYSAGWLSTAVPVRFLLIPVALAAIATTRVLGGGGLRGMSLVGIGIATVVLAGSAVVGWDTWWSATAGERVVRYLLLFTAAFLLGLQLRQSGHTGRWGVVYLGWSLAAAPLAAFEYLRNATVVPRDDIQSAIVRDDRLRAVLLAEHPLVLATLLALALPMALRASTRSRQIAAAAVLIAGIYSTQSRGVLAVAVIYTCGRLALGTMPRVAVGTRSLVVPVLMLMLVVGGVVAIADPAIINDRISSKDPAQASLQYRGVLYSRVAESLLGHPFGWGPMGLPKGVYVLNSPLGSVDLALTIDSEPVLLVLEYGILGLAAFLAVMALSVDRALRSDDWMGDALVIVVVCGSFLAIHSWTGLGAVAFLLIGGNASRGMRRGVRQTEVLEPSVARR